MMLGNFGEISPQKVGENFGDFSPTPQNRSPKSPLARHVGEIRHRSAARKRRHNGAEKLGIGVPIWGIGERTSRYFLMFSPFSPYPQLPIRKTKQHQTLIEKHTHYIFVGNYIGNVGEWGETKTATKTKEAA